MIACAEQLGETVGIAAACGALDLSRATYYRRAAVRKRATDNREEVGVSAKIESAPITERPFAVDTEPSDDLTLQPMRAEPNSLPSAPEIAAPEIAPTVTLPSVLLPSRCRVPGRALSIELRTQLLDYLHSERFVDLSPREVYATLLDEGVYIASISTYYRVLAGQNEVVDRRPQRRTGLFQKPELLASAPNQLWSWDITKLLGPAKWTYYYLYVVLDVFSRYVVGWSLDYSENSTLAEQLIADSITKQGVEPGQLTIHADRGSSMTSKTLAQLMVDLGIDQSHSRPHVSNDNPFSEAQFKTLKYRPEFPAYFGSIEAGRDHCRKFFPWYNTQHHHTGLALLTPEVVHYGRSDEVVAARQKVLDDAFAAHPEQFRGRPPIATPPPTAVWINPPAKATDLTTEMIDTEPSNTATQRKEA